MSGMGCSTTNQMTSDDWKITDAPKEAVQAFAAIRSDGSVVTWGFAYLGLGAQRGQRPNFQGKQHRNCALSFSFGRKVLADQTPSKLVRKVPMQMLVATCCIRPLHPGIPIVSAGIPVFSCREKGGEPPTFGRRQQQRSAVGTGGCKGPRSRMARQRFLKPI